MSGVLTASHIIVSPVPAVARTAAPPSCEQAVTASSDSATASHGPLADCSAEYSVVKLYSILLIDSYPLMQGSTCKHQELYRHQFRLNFGTK